MKKTLIILACALAFISLESCGPKPNVDPDKDKGSKDYPFPDSDQPPQ